MYSIGEFSKINHITTKTLRHYDRIGLFKPAEVDEWTGYRYYTRDQLHDIARILELRDLGFALDEIAGILRGRDQEAACLNARIAALANEKELIDLKIERARSWLERMEDSNQTRRPPDITIKALPEVIVASMRLRVPSYDSFFDVVPKMGEYMHSVGAVCHEPAYCFTIYHDGEYREKDIDAEVCEAVIAPCRESDRVKFKTIEAVQEAACLLHRGPYASLATGYNALFTWIDAQGFLLNGLPRESYIDGIWNRNNPDDWLTEIQVPVTRV